MIICYVAHCYGGSAANRERAADWCAWLAKHGFAPVADWIVLTSRWTEDMRDRGLAIDCALIEVCHVMAQCGPRISGGMLVEADHAQGLPVPVPIVRGPDVMRCDQMTPEQEREFLKALRDAVRGRT